MMKGIVLTDGRDSRLDPLSRVMSKQLLPIYDKPMIHYPLATLMLAGIRDILVISTPGDLPAFQRLLRDGDELGLTIDYAEQKSADGIAQAFLIGADHIGDDNCALILGDNVFHGPRFSDLLHNSVRALDRGTAGCVLFGCPADSPRRHGVGETDAAGQLVAVGEKLVEPCSHRAVTGLYLYDRQVVEIARSLKPSARGELEITDVNSAYIRQGTACLVDLGRGFAWLDTGTPESLLDAGVYVQMLERLQGVRIACVEEIALRMGYIDAHACYKLGERMCPSGYGQYVIEVAESFRSTAQS